MKIFINFADENFKKKQNFALKTAKLFGNFDKVIGYKPDNIDIDFFKKNKRTLLERRGAGYWLWKPYFILKTLNECSDGDFIFYLDAGLFMTGKVDLLISNLEKSGQEIMTFQTFYPERQWTKGGLFLNMNCDKNDYQDSNQFVASFCLIKNSAKARAFFSEWLDFSEVYENICDVEEKYLQTKDFIEHRNDQSIFSLLCKKNKLEPFRPPYVFGKKGAAFAVTKKIEKVYGKNVVFNFIDFKNSNYPTIIHTSKPFKIFGFSVDLFFISFLYLSLLNKVPFDSLVYKLLLKLGVGAKN